MWINFAQYGTKKDKLILINKGTTPLDSKADYVLDGDISKILWDIVEDIIE